MSKKQKIKLTRKEREGLLKVATAGMNNARVIVRAQVMLKAADGWTDKKIGDAFNTSSVRVRRIRLKCLKVGAIGALEEAPRSGQPRELCDTEEQMLIALACSKPPAGYARWTIRLLTREAIARKHVHTVVPETIRRVLQKTQLSRGR